MTSLTQFFDTVRFHEWSLWFIVMIAAAVV